MPSGDSWRARRHLVRVQPNRDLLALFTAIAGAAVGGNLLLLALAIAWDCQVRDRFAAAKVKEKLEARPSTG